MRVCLAPLVAYAFVRSGMCAALLLKDEAERKKKEEAERKVQEAKEAADRVDAKSL